VLIAAALLAPIAIACASPAKVTAANQIATARYAIREAVAKDANLYAPDELQVARAKFDESQSATPDVGVRLAQQATVLARLASAVAARESAQAQLAEAVRVQSQSETLRVETIEAVEETER
jgi:hypothetical protein